MTPKDLRKAYDSGQPVAHRPKSFGNEIIYERITALILRKIDGVDKYSAELKSVGINSVTTASAEDVYFINGVDYERKI